MSDISQQHLKAALLRQTEAVIAHGGRGDREKAISNAIHGPNVLGGGSALPTNKDNQGLLFFTRPRLNLTYDNAKNSRILLPYVLADKDTMQRAIRVMLDPVSQGAVMPESHMRGGFTGNTAKSTYMSMVPPNDIIDSSLVDADSPWLHLLANTSISLTGWPDELVDTFTSEAGVGKEEYVMVDTYARNYGAFDLTATFRNIEGDPITSLLRVWEEYMARCFEGSMTPWPDTIMEHELDYQTRIFRIVLDSSRRKVQKIASAVGGFPTGNPVGSYFDYEQGTPLNTTNDQITMPIRCIGAEYNDPILVTEFNDISFIFNPQLEVSVNNEDDTVETDYMLVSHNDLALFNNFLYPIINEDTWEMQYWVKRTVYNYIAEKFYKNSTSNSTTGET